MRIDGDGLAIDDYDMNDNDDVDVDDNYDSMT